MPNRNTRRFDLSDRLIHFFRALDLDHGPGFTTPETWRPGDLAEDTKFSPFFLLRNAVRCERLWATWSVRNGRRTIYGPDPAVCFTDMPLAAFIEAGETRSARGEAMSTYGLLLPKTAMHGLGARSVIYGLSTSPFIPKGDDGGPRISGCSAFGRAVPVCYSVGGGGLDARTGVALAVPR
jgi:hypothetical protein